MNEWYFSKNGSITDAMNFASAKKYVTANPDAYGWKQTYSQWLPLHCISDFVDILPAPQPTEDLSESITKEFNNKEQALLKKLEKVGTAISNSEKIANEFSQEIDVFTKITQNLSDEVKANIDSIKQQHSLLNKKLTEIKQSTNTAQTEISQVIANFNSKSIHIPTDAQSAITQQNTIKSTCKATVVASENKDTSIKVETKSESKGVNKVAGSDTKEVTSSSPQSAKEKIASKPAINTNLHQDTPIEAEIKPSTSDIVSLSDVKRHKTRQQRPANAKFISTKARSPAQPKSIEKQAQLENNATKELAKNDGVSENIDNASSTIQVKASPPETKEKTLNNDNLEVTPSAIHDKISDSVKGMFNSMFNAKEETTTMSERLKSITGHSGAELAGAGIEDDVGDDVIPLIQDDEQPKKRKRRRRR